MFEKGLDLLAMVLTEEDRNLVDDYLAGDLYYRDNNEVLKKYKGGIVLASVDVRPKYSENNFIYLFSSVLGFDLLFSFLIFKSGDRNDIRI